MKPFASVVIIIVTLFSVVFLKMEVRRLGYVVLKETKSYKALRDEYRLKSMEYVAMIRADHIRSYAESHLTLSEARNGQIIQLVGQQIAVPQ